MPISDSALMIEVDWPSNLPMAKTLPFLIS